MFGRIVFAVFIVVPLIEIGLFILIGQAIGIVPTLLGVLLTAIAGALLIRWQGLAVLRDLQATVGRGELPARQLADAMLIALGGVLLLLPGYFTDFCGVLLFLPPVRGLIYRSLARRFTIVGAAPGTPPADPTLVDLDASRWRER
jgi:UPF0716 protein FxsA